MSTHGGQVTLSIGGRPYTVACAAGEEDHIKRLAALVDEKMAQLGSARAPQASQNLLFCALLLADDLHERTAELAEVSASLAHVRRDRGASDDHRDRAEEEKSSLLSKISQLRADAERFSEERGGMAAEIDRLHRQLAEQAGSPAKTFSASSDDPALAPALEHFAEMLEKCADGLEGRLGSAAAMH
ncbi:cell division protein ZapA [Pseudopontixanthobacter vadosimaris]|uniref:cell division protein ZapA n=1 Tax=Pseudopontixanthobacter vadosimaris TaxID=2726450 RepID=UPI001474FCC3|nr:cell division protein ZapA [Pseudopontixanthobacter vadosimaris]